MDEPLSKSDKTAELREKSRISQYLSVGSISLFLPNSLAIQ